MCFSLVFSANLLDRLLNVEQVQKNGKPLLYLVFEYLDIDLKKFIDSHRKGPNPRPIPSTVVQVPMSSALPFHWFSFILFSFDGLSFCLQRFMFQLCKGVAHCHSHGVLHRLYFLFFVCYRFLVIFSYAWLDFKTETWNLKISLLTKRKAY